MPITIIQAIGRMEGFGVSAPNIPNRCNNPGDLCAGQFANVHGAIPNAPDPHNPNGGPFRYAVFPTVEQGWAALRALLVHHYAGMTVEEAISRYAPATENNTAGYVAAVCHWTGLLPSDTLTAENIG